MTKFSYFGLVVTLCCVALSIVIKFSSNDSISKILCKNLQYLLANAIFVG